MTAATPSDPNAAPEPAPLDPAALDSAPLDPAALGLDPAIGSWAARNAEIAAGLPALGGADPVAHREAGLRLSDLLAAEFTEPVPAGVAIDDIRIAGGDGPLRARRFRPADAPAALPTLVWCHGGGFIGGTIDEILNDRLCAGLALRSRVQILSIEYRLAPEHPYPAAVDDLVAAVHDARARPAALGIDPSRIGVGGNSAGATIAATTAIRLRDAGSPAHHQALEVLPAALRVHGASMAQYARGFGLDDALDLAEVYRAGAPLSESSPLDAPDHRDLPPTLLMIAEHDPLRDGALAYADALRSASVPVSVHLGRGHVHGSPGLTARWQGSRDWREAFAAGLARGYAVDA